MKFTKIVQKCESIPFSEEMGSFLQSFTSGRGAVNEAGGVNTVAHIYQFLKKLKIMLGYGKERQNN